MQKFRNRVLCFLMMLLIAVSAAIMCACTNDKKDDSSDSELRAADPMTEEELENDDTGGCIEDSEDLLN